MKKNTLTGIVALSICFVFMLPAYSAEVVKKGVDAQASKDADRFLEGLKIADLPEGKQILKETSWHLKEIPILHGQKALFEGMFDTDMPNMKGYKRLLEVTVQSKAGTNLTKKHILISYKDKHSGTWKVLAFRESSDVEAAVKYFKEKLGDTSIFKDQTNYASYGYWTSLAGKLQESFEAYKRAADLNRADPAKYSPQEVFDENVETIRRIIESGSK